MLYLEKYLRYFIILAVFVGVSSCKVLKSAEKNKISSISEKIITLAKSYKGVPYKSGGNDFKGVDCSGLVFTIFKEMGIKIPRVSWQQADFFSNISKNDIQKGDLVFFSVNKPSSSGSKINHVGIVMEVKSKTEIIFMSALTNTGVGESNLYSSYWKDKFVKVTRYKEKNVQITKKVRV